MKPIVIGIAGGSASGKSSIAQNIYNKYPDSTVIIRTDDYYKPQNHLTLEERLLTNYDHPLAFDNDLLLEHIKMLIDNKPIDKPIYDFIIYNRKQETEKINPAKVIIIEGLFVLENLELLKLLDIKLFVDTESDIRFIRRMLRDVKDRGRSIESVVKQYLNNVRDMHISFVEPSKRNADLIIPVGAENTVAFEMLCSRINTHLLNK